MIISQMVAIKLLKGASPAPVVVPTEDGRAAEWLIRFKRRDNR